MSEEQNARDISDIRINMVRKDVHEAEQRTVETRLTNIERDSLALEAKVDKAEERRAADRRLILTSLVLPIIVALVLLYVQTQIGSGR